MTMIIMMMMMMMMVMMTMVVVVAMVVMVMVVAMTMTTTMMMMVMMMMMMNIDSLLQSMALTRTGQIVRRIIVHVTSSKLSTQLSIKAAQTSYSQCTNS